VVFGCVLAALSAWALIVGEPWGIRCIRQKMAEGTTRALIDGVTPGFFYDWVDGLTFWAKGADERGLTAVVLADHRLPQKPWLISAARGTLEVGAVPHELHVVLDDGRMLQEGATVGTSHVLTFAKGIWRIDVGAMVRQKLHRLPDAQELSMAALYEQSQQADLSHDARVLRQYMWHRKLAVPVAAIIFTLLAVPLGASARSGHRVGGMLLATLLVAAYYHVGRLLELAARGGMFGGALAAWLPNGVGALACALMLWRMGRQRP
jgi:lipopolysaccharide export LptBFGC system permease protein LptF